jgi:hypothetical protein
MQKLQTRGYIALGELAKLGAEGKTGGLTPIVVPHRNATGKMRLLTTATA